VVRESEAGEQLVGRIQPPQVALREYPASYNRAPIVPPEAAVISADPAMHERWTPRLRRTVKALAGYFWIAAIVAALSALWLRRGPVKTIKS
jgi:hypothetical protein